MSIRKVYDSLHGVSDDAVSLSAAIEIIAYCLIDGKVEQGSGFETDLYNDLVEQLKSMKDGFATHLNARYCNFETLPPISAFRIYHRKMDLQNQNSTFQSEHWH